MPFEGIHPKPTQESSPEISEEMLVAAENELSAVGAQVMELYRRDKESLIRNATERWRTLDARFRQCHERLMSYGLMPSLGSLMALGFVRENPDSALSERMAALMGVDGFAVNPTVWSRLLIKGW